MYVHLKVNNVRINNLGKGGQDVTSIISFVMGTRDLYNTKILTMITILSDFVQIHIEDMVIKGQNHVT